MPVILMQIMMILFMWISMLMLSFKSNKNPKSLMPFECGFSSFSKKLPISIQFSLMVFIFMLFDVELTILISAMWNISTYTVEFIISMIMFFIMLLISLIYELIEKIIKWIKEMNNSKQ